MRSILFIVLSLISLHTVANGGITTHSSVTGTGNPVFMDMPSINISSEKLYIKLDDGYSHIKVKYVLQNTSGNDYKDLDYGFPIDYIVGERENPVQWEDNYITDVSFKKDNQLLYHTISPERVYNKEDGVYRRWCFTKLSIPQKSSIELEVYYSIMNGHVVEGSSPLNIDLSGNGYYLYYDFSPASHLGDGIIKDFYVKIDATKADLSEEYYPHYIPIHVKDMDDFNEQMLQKVIYSPTMEFTEKNGIYTYQTHDFDLNKSDPLHLAYYCDFNWEGLLDKRLNKNDYSVSTSVEVSGYPVTNLNDEDLTTAWVAPKGGVGEWIEITLKKPYKSISGFTLVNGYMKNEKTFTENNRIKKFRIDLKGTSSNEYNSYIFDIEKYELNTQYQRINFGEVVKYSGVVDFYEYEYPGYGNENTNLHKIRITILEVYPGTKYQDTCISEIILF